MTGPSPIKKNVIIIGAGASGLFCAAECGKHGRSVLVLDHARRIGSKILISGGGRSNFTNLNMTADHYLSRNPHFCKSALARFTPQDILSLVKKHEISCYEKADGQIFCAKGSREIVTLLEQECERAGVEIRTNCRVSDIIRESGFVLTTNRGAFRSDSLVIATGGLSYENLGASGIGYDVARRFGLRVTKVRPALVPFIFSGPDKKNFKNLAGVSFEAAISCAGRSFRGSILFTHRGLSGPAVLQASLYWYAGEPLGIDLLPDTNILAVLFSRRQSRMELQNLLGAYLPKRIARAWCEHLRYLKPINQFSDKEIKEIAKELHSWEIIPKGTEGYKTAEVTAGGVDTDELSSKTMEAKRVPGLYFIGEVMDVTGRLGGYNLHWAWASAHAAGRYA